MMLCVVAFVGLPDMAANRKGATSFTGTYKAAQS